MRHRRSTSPSAAKTSAAPASSGKVTASASSSQPHRIPSTGIRKVTDSVREGPISRTSVKKARYATPLHSAPSATAEAVAGRVHAAAGAPAQNGDLRSGERGGGEGGRSRG